MAEPLSFAREAAQRAESAWDPARIELALAATHRGIARGRRRRRIATSLAAAVMVALGLGALWSMRDRLGQRDEATVLTQATDRSESSAAGWTIVVGASQIAAVLEGTDVRALPDDGTRAGLELLAGMIEVDAHGLYVLAGGRRLDIDEARFRLTLLPRGFELHVLAGTVDFGGRSLTAGTTFVFDPDAAPAATAPTPALVPPAADVVPAPTRRTAKPGAAAKPLWRTLVQSREWTKAYDEMKRADPSTVRSSVDALMAAADAARFGGHPEEAPSYLREVLDDHRRHAMAPLAAFTLGRVYLEQLGEPSKAAAAFADAQDLAPTGALAADALAREVEALAKAGKTELAQQRARLYLERHPDGRRVAAVRRHAGL
ncbi:MAG: hypothetical protein K1X88_10670 [Nannocystaceae bacterium]|nr:hypothetical protein [Nannocystaceae bacterium]